MEQTFIVEKEHTAKALGSGTLEVLSTPYLVAMVENTCLKEIAEKLSKGQTTVGARMDISHLKATKVGASYTIETQLIKEGRTSYTFTFQVFSQDEKIAEGQHLRVRVNEHEFMEKNS